MSSIRREIIAQSGYVKITRVFTQSKKSLQRLVLLAFSDLINKGRDIRESIATGCPEVMEALLAYMKEDASDMNASSAAGVALALGGYFKEAEAAKYALNSVIIPAGKGERGDDSRDRAFDSLM